MFHRLSLLCLTLIACSGGKDEEVVSPPEPGPDLDLSKLERLTRMSIAVTGARPAPEMLADPPTEEQALDEWLQSDEFGLTMRDLHGEQFMVRTDIVGQLPTRGPLKNHSIAETYDATVSAPLRLVERVIMEDMPYTEILTADWMMANSVLSKIYGLDVPNNTKGWVVSHWSDGRPPAGVLSGSELWRRHVSAGSNFNRGRSNFIAKTFLCEEFAARDIAIIGGVDLSNELEVADAVTTNPTCVGCHQAMDPLAAHFFGFKKQLKDRIVTTSYRQDCQWDPDDPLELPEGGLMEDYCYPVRFYVPNNEDEWMDWNLRQPSFFGSPSSNLTELGQNIADDPRFATCTVKRFWSYFAQIDTLNVPEEVVDDLRDTFVSSNFNAKELVRAIVTHDRFLSTTGEGAVGLLHTRPEQYSRTFQNIADYSWMADPERKGCEKDFDCWKQVNLLNSDRYGFRTMLGGVDGIQVTFPTHSVIPTQPLTLERLAAEFAGDFVPREFDKPQDERHLFTKVQQLSTTDEDQIREQLVWLRAAFISEFTEPDDPAVDELVTLFQAVGDNERAWKVIVAALIQDPAGMFF